MLAKATAERQELVRLRRENRRRFKTQTEAKMAVFEWLEGWYNAHRRHSALGRISPINFERRQLTQKAA
jgi:transposase InsO family protein